MSKAISAELKAHLAEEVSTVATCWRVARRDGVELFFTDHDVAIVFDGDTYEAESGMVPSGLSQKRGLTSDNIEVQAFLDSEKITEADLEAGLYDFATLDIFIVNYEDLTMGRMFLREGAILGNVEMRDHSFQVEVSSKADKLERSIVDLSNKRCRYVLGDEKCTVDLGQTGMDWTQEGSVVSVTSRQVFVTSALVHETRLKYGKVIWKQPESSGSSDSLNAGLEMEVKDYDPATNTLTLFLPMPYTIDPGDEFTIIVGDDKLFSTCRDFFLNWINFGGEPFIPGEETIPMGRPTPEGRHGWSRGR